MLAAVGGEIADEMETAQSIRVISTSGLAKLNPGLVYSGPVN